MRLRPRPSSAFLVLVACGCTALPTIPAGVCGNGVIEPPEDCDTFSPNPASVCRPKGVAGACHLDCQRRSDGTRPSCPAGWGCDADDLCRAPTPDFGHAIESTVGSASSLMAADFDGDGRAEVISATPEDAVRRTHLSFHYFDDRGALVETRLFPKLLGSPVFTELSGDGRSDLVFTGFGVGVLLGRSDRVWVPETFHSYVLPDAHVRMLSVYDDLVQGDSALLALTTIGGVPGLYVSGNATGRLERHGELPGPVETLTGAVSGDVIEGADSPCREVIVGVKGASAFSVLDPCGRDPETHALVWRDRATRSSVALEPPAPIEGNPEVADMNGDGHLDVLIGASGRPYVAYGDGQRLATAAPYRPDGDDGSDGAAFPMPLAVGDFTGDGVVDFVFADGLAVSAPTPNSSRPTYVAKNGNAGARWTVATIADMNGNGKLDVMAASDAAPGIDFFNGTGAPDLIASNLPTSGTVQQLAVADFDGDLTNDLAFIATGAKGQDADSLWIAFGSLGGLLAPPVQVAQVRGTEQLSAYRQSSIGSLTVASNEVAVGHDTGTLTLLDGSSDRLPFAPYGLVTVSPDGTLQGSNPLVLTVGAFTAAHQPEVLALATRDPKDGFQLWLGPTQEAAGNTPLSLEGGFDPRLEPWTVTDAGLKIHVAVASADVDGDGLDESLWLMPADDGQHCALATADASRKDGGQFVIKGTVFLDDPCVAPVLLPVDADRDGAVDVALLTGGEGDVERRLLVLWNDGRGGFSADALTVVSGDAPRAFTALPATAAQPLRLAYVTRDAAIVVDGANARRVFGAARSVMTLEDGTGVAAADVNGDGVVDLAVADSGNVSVLLARLKTE